MQASSSDLYQEKEDNQYKQREENSTLVRTGQYCTLFPVGGVVWKIPYYLSSTLFPSFYHQYGTEILYISLIFVPYHVVLTYHKRLPDKYWF